MPAPPPGVVDRWVGVGDTAEEHGPLKVELLLSFTDALVHRDQRIVQVWGNGGSGCIWRQSKLRDSCFLQLEVFFDRYIAKNNFLFYVMRISSHWKIHSMVSNSGQICQSVVIFHLRGNII